MNDRVLSYTVLEFFCWNPHWDKYLQTIVDNNKKKHEQHKEVVKS